MLLLFLLLPPLALCFSDIGMRVALACGAVAKPSTPELPLAQEVPITLSPSTASAARCPGLAGGDAAALMNILTRQTRGYRMFCKERNKGERAENLETLNWDFGKTTLSSEYLWVKPVKTQ